MKTFLTFIQMLGWILAIWLFVGLIGSLRWLSAGADPGPEALKAVAIKVIALAAFIGVWALSARIGDRRAGRTTESSLA
jgi:hypothetical protein